MKERTKKYLFGVITPLLGLLVIELLTRGAFNLFGRYNDWGYAASSNLHRPYIGFAYKPYETGRDRYAFKLDSNDYLHRDLTEKEACEFRIFMLGGSTVDGRHLNGVDDPLPARLERRLNDQLSFNVGFSLYKFISFLVSGKSSSSTIKIPPDLTFLKIIKRLMI